VLGDILAFFRRDFDNAISSLSECLVGHGIGKRKVDND
jgi:hypothetical protein